ncbi:hypothetical protein BHECKSOX_937 [Bathymodiolus heckerae thiotrophic gill symbiont]|nr:hypothetical protein [Bathymodiolus heckerae thiotrophic gill symbiont]CAC9527826.1 hypothetical protein [uncultured Gammaproteobacteria bacterium]SHN90704.1 hypothetical protein BHECKSOX_937 [Bathymodiolus heckerae thiotrophic gill symbiont]
MNNKKIALLATTALSVSLGATLLIAGEKEGQCGEGSCGSKK